MTDLRTAPFVLLDDSRADHKAGASWFYHSPEKIITATSFDEIDEALAEIDTATKEGLFVAGWISYEVAHAFEKKLAVAITRQAEEPLIWMIATRNREKLSPRAVRELLHTSNHGNQHFHKLALKEPANNETSYKAALKAVQNFITAGDVYQINHTFPLQATLTGDPLALYAQLRAIQPVGYSAYIDTGTYQVLSLSPELFVEKRGDTLTSRPMKGTAARGRTEHEDRETQAFLKQDLKSRAENLMIVDLIRNDMGRISMPASVRVETLFSTEQYATLHQMTSTVTATAKEKLSPSELLRAMFPCGSVTGAPKIRAMEIIQSLETNARGVYCGAIGHFSKSESHPNKDHWSLSVPIRTFILKNGKGRLGIGSGIVADSNADEEYAECLLKAAFTKTQTTNFCLIETMKLENGTIAFEENHLDRLASSATYFDFKYNRHEIQQALIDHLAILEGHPIYRIRLLLDKYGHASVTSAKMPVVETAHTPKELTICLSATPVDSRNIFLFHKTTNRKLYDSAFAQACAAGYCDILFSNESGHLTEGAISSLFLVKDGTWYTPPLACGLLPGIMRAHMLAANPDIQIKALTRDDLFAADTVYIANALRGLRSVTPISKEISITF
ncbi:aminodeoxychorismate synthase component I [Kordiimonas pumila]|uniref:Probable branched-chain-amino-acid aminotransferase n=1 Tax=Kordiimonas pumila TaxID=2161677 RepID=A0ABV7D5F6_9PROT|nr:aminodeoxychorismate synthase component I [Kordiimonas pumila]